MSEVNNQIIAKNIFERLYWLTNNGGLTTFNMSVISNYYYKLSNKDMEKEPMLTICDNNVDSLDDFYKVIELVEEQLENNLQVIKDQTIIDVDDYKKPLYILLKLREE